MPVRAIREQVASAIDIIVQQSRFRDGSRRITQITEVLGMEEDTIVMQDIFRFEQTGITPQGKITGGFQATGIVPRFNDNLKSCGINLPEDIFMPFEGLGGRRR